MNRKARYLLASVLLLPLLVWLLFAAFQPQTEPRYSVKELGEGWPVAIDSHGGVYLQYPNNQSLISGVFRLSPEGNKIDLSTPQGQISSILLDETGIAAMSSEARSASVAGLKVPHYFLWNEKGEWINAVGKEIVESASHAWTRFAKDDRAAEGLFELMDKIFVWEGPDREKILKEDPQKYFDRVKIHDFFGSDRLLGELTVGGRTQLFVYQANGNRFEPLEGIPDGANSFKAAEVDGETQVIFKVGEKQAFLWKGGTATEIPSLGTMKIVPRDINSKGVVVGGADRQWPTGKWGNQVSRLFDWLGRHGQRRLVFGVFNIFYYSPAVIWDGGEPEDLNDLISSESEAFLIRAVGINASGQILALGAPGGGIAHVYLLTPIEESLKE